MEVIKEHPDIQHIYRHNQWALKNKLVNIKLSHASITRKVLEDYLVIFINYLKGLYEKNLIDKAAYESVHKISLQEHKPRFWNKLITKASLQKCKALNTLVSTRDENKLIERYNRRAINTKSIRSSYSNTSTSTPSSPSQNKNVTSSTKASSSSSDHQDRHHVELNRNRNYRSRSRSPAVFKKRKTISMKKNRKRQDSDYRDSDSHQRLSLPINYRQINFTFFQFGSH